jgi:hypothetical protein
MELAAMQRQLRDLIKHLYHPTADDPPYVRRVADSPGLAMVQEIILWWRTSLLQQYCRLTTQALQARHCLTETVHAFTRARALSPFIEELGEAFLQDMRQHPDSLLASVAQFEYALLCVKRGHEQSYVVYWDYEPYSILHCLMQGLPLAMAQRRGRYQTVVSRHISGYFQVRAVPPGGLDADGDCSLSVSRRTPVIG